MLDKNKKILIISSITNLEKYTINGFVNLLKENSINLKVISINNNTCTDPNKNINIIEEIDMFIPDTIIIQDEEKDIQNLILELNSKFLKKYNVLTFDTPSQEKFNKENIIHKFRPNLFISIPKKYIDNLQLEKHLADRAKNYGKIISKDYAEGFTLIESYDDNLLNMTIAPDLIKINNKSLVPYLVSLIEHKYLIKDIKVGNFPLWQFLRYRIGLHIWFKKEIKDSSSLNPYFINNANNLLKRIFKGFFKSFNIFSKFNYILFTESSEIREYKNNLFTEKLAHNIIKYHGKDILVSLNVIENKFFSFKNFTFTKYTDSIFFYILSFIFYFKKITIENSQIIEEIEREYGFSISYHKKVKDFFRLVHFWKFYFKIKKIKCIYFYCSYAPVLHHAAVYAAKLNNIKTVDMQHAMIDHSYYITNDIGKDSYPEYMFVFGDFFKKFVFENYIKKENIISVGNFFLEYSLEKSKRNSSLNDYFLSLRKEFKKVICVSMQEVFEVELLKFIYKVAELDKSICFLIIRRLKKDYIVQDKYNNVKETTNLGFHESIYFCDYHVSVNSFCAVEALYFNKINFLVNINNNSKSYWGGILNEKYNTYFIENETELLSLINSKNICRHDFNSEYFFAKNNEEKIMNAIKTINNLK